VPQGVNRSALVVVETADRQALLRFPAPHSALAAVEVRGNFLPGFQPVAAKNLDLGLRIQAYIILARRKLAVTFELATHCRYASAG
jgi:hypothetical protein